MTTGAAGTVALRKKANDSRYERALQPSEVHGSRFASSMLVYRRQESRPQEQQRFQREPIPPGAVGVAPDDVTAMQQKLRERWDPDARVHALELKVQEYAERHGGLDELAASHLQKGDPEMEILNKLVADGEDQLQKQPCEVATLEVLKSGMRDYIDYALAEVDRYGHLARTGDAFDWRAQGKAADIPVLYRSKIENSVGPVSSPAGRASTSSTFSSMLEPDPLDERFSTV
mmetsp:Transcript_73903/g.171433  ORF Transcript_73903/g.171433 Transcript_73903/m.171433 type:complete len:231 (+) Transcript_73903:40-732(+)